MDSMKIALTHINYTLALVKLVLSIILDTYNRCLCSFKYAWLIFNSFSWVYIKWNNKLPKYKLKDVKFVAASSLISSHVKKFTPRVANDAEWTSKQKLIYSVHTGFRTTDTSNTIDSRFIQKPGSTINSTWDEFFCINKFYVLICFPYT